MVISGLLPCCAVLRPVLCCVLCFVVCLQLGGLLFGYDIGASSGVLASLTNPELSGTDW